MTKMIVLWGTGLACALGGALAGNAVGSSPVTDRSTIEMIYQSHRTAYRDVTEQRALPNHYPLVTRSGVVPVAQLSDRGLFSQQRYRPFEPFAGDDADRFGDDPGPGFIESEPDQVAAVPVNAATPPALDAGPTKTGGQAKIIDVRAALAMR